MNKFIKVLIRPSEVFKEEKEKASLKKAVLIFLFTSFIVGIINLIGFFLNPQSTFLLSLLSLILPINVQLIQLVMIIFFLLIIPIASIIIVFIFSLIGFAISKFFGGSGNYKTFLYFASIYYVPLGLITAILSQIPEIGQYAVYAVIVYAAYPFTIAIKESFNLSTRKAIAVWLIPILIITPIISYPMLSDWYQQQQVKQMLSNSDTMNEAIKSDNINLCNSIIDASYKNTCIAIISRNSTKCIGQENQTCAYNSSWTCEYCFKEIAEKTNNTDLCLSIQNPNTKKECVEYLAIVTKDNSLCNKLSDEPFSTFPNDSERKDCFYVVGIMLKDLRTCSLVKDEEKRITCTAIAENDINICNQLESYSLEFCKNIYNHPDIFKIY